MLHRGDLLGFAVDREGVADVVLHLSDPFLESGAVRMGGERVDDLDLSLELDFLAEYPQRILPL